MNEAELIKLLLNTFKIEAKEHIEIIVKGLIELEKNPKQERKKSILEEVYRSAHSMKGAARSVNLSEVERICQSLESCFSLMKSEELNPTSDIFDIFHNVIKTVETLIDDSKENPSKQVLNRTVDILESIKFLEEDENEEDENKEAEIASEDKEVSGNNSYIEVEASEILESNDKIEKVEKDNEAIDNSEIKSPQDTIRLSSKKLDDIYLLAEDSLQIKISHDQELKEIKEILEDFKQINTHWSEIFNETYRIRSHESQNHETIHNNHLNNKLFDTYDVIDDEIKQLNKKIIKLSRTSKYVSNTTDNIIGNLVDEIKHILMVPFTNLMNGFPLMVRDLAKDMKKEVHIDIKGAEIEVDRRIMEELKDPLIHIIRNCIDHGIEKPDYREKIGKNRHGSISVNINQIDANHVQIDITDDGSGIDKEKVKKKALVNEVLSEDEINKLDDNGVYNLIFQSGLSTSEIITDISGRGLGLAIVDGNIEKLGGKISIQSEKGKQSKFSIIIPTTISKSQGLLVRLNKKHFIIPVSNIIETLRIKPKKIKKVENKSTIQFKGSILPLIHLSEVLELNHEDISKKEHIFVVAIESMNQRLGLIVDEVLDEKEVLFKKLSFPLLKARNVAGVSILGDGEICPILNNQDIMRTSLSLSGNVEGISKKKEDDEKQKSIIIAEDSITSRLFIKNILESAGYKVKATVDGKEAFMSLKQEKFDLIVSDVEMPRMNGFELTQSVRKDSKLKDLPIILVTSLNKRADQEKGVEVGANAYIVKSSFEQSNLLETIKKLI